MKPPPGTHLDTVWVEIDYAILQHFSKHLYSSPNKAVEELVTNGYDALATNVKVFLPGEHAENLLVWDNGTSMDVEGLKHLWWIARSPKEDGESREVTNADGSIRRKMVGKFGIGKLASYAVGNAVAHLCRRGEEYLLVRVDYEDAPRLDEIDAGEQERGFSTPLLKLTQEEALSFVRELFLKEPDDLDDLLAESQWTLAIVSDIRDGVVLAPGRLKWVLGNGMPLRPDFRVSVNGLPVAPAALSGQLIQWNAHDDKIQAAVKTAWREKRDAGEVEGEPEFRTRDDDKSTGWSRCVLEFPSLGSITLYVRLFSESLRKGRLGEHGRSEGFFIYVRGRLINPDDAKFLLPDPSYGSFNRMHAVIHADGLDGALLADRERLSRDSPSSAELAALQTAIYLASRSFLEDHDADAGQPESIHSLLPKDSREFFIGPLVALAQRAARESDASLNAMAVTLDQTASGVDNPLVDFVVESNSLVVNTSHPLFEAARVKLGSGKTAKEALRLIEILAISDATYAGHLLDVGIAENEVDSLIRWRDAQLRTLAQRYTASGAEVYAELHDASFVGGKRFEKAIAAVFRHMGFCFAQGRSVWQARCLGRCAGRLWA